MVGIVSATQRQSFASFQGEAPAIRNSLATLFSALRSDSLRLLCLASALMLGVLAAFAPHVDGSLLTATLLLLGLMLAMLAARGSSAAGALALAPDLRNEAASTPASGRAKMLDELLQAARRGAGEDVEQWCHVTARMSHELRTPLNAVLGFSELMKGEVFGPLGSQQYAEYARSIHKSGRTLLKSAEDALAITNLLTRAPSLGNEPAASLLKGVNDALDFHGLGLEDLGIGVVLGVEPTLDVTVEAQTLRQIMINLVSEAMERAAEGACITFESESFLLDATLRISVAVPAEKRAAKTESFALILSRTLAQFCGARLDEESTDESWAVCIQFPRAVQRDFFAHVGH